MIGVKIKLTLDDRVLEEIELTVNPSLDTTCEDRIVYHETGRSYFGIQHEQGLQKTLTDMVEEYHPRLMSNEHLKFSVSSFLYDPVK